MREGRTWTKAGLLVVVFLAGASATWLLKPAAIGTPSGGADPHAHGAAETSDQASTWYTCGMHPEVVQDHPGECPKCGMKLQPMAHDRAVAMGLAEEGEEADGEASGDRKIVFWKSSMIPGEIHEESGKDSMGMDLVPVYDDEVSAAGAIRIDPVTEQNIGVRVTPVIRGPLVQTVRTVGIVEYDETTLAAVTTKVDGWVEKLYVEKTGDQVHAGDPLFELYSPELFSAQQEYLAAVRNRQEDDVPGIPEARLDSDALIRDARTRLEYFDISVGQIRELERRGTVQKTLTIKAPFTGIVTHKSVVEGQMIKAGTDIFRIADLSTVWVIGKVFEQDISYVAMGQEALMSLTYLPGRTFRGRVTYVYPYLEMKTREIPVRMEFHNPGYELKPGMYATITLRSQIHENVVLVPDVAVIDTGVRQVVFVMPEPGRYEARELTIGPRSEGNYLQAIAGVAPGEQVVVSGQFLLDSESRLREAALKFLEPGTGDAATPVKPVGMAEHEGPAVHGAAGEQAQSISYACPMPEHVDILYAAPGACPICGMALVPVPTNGDAAVGGHADEPVAAHAH